MDKIVVFGPGPGSRRIANYNTSLAKALDKLNVAEIYIVSWTQQYPAIIPRILSTAAARPISWKGQISRSTISPITTALSAGRNGWPDQDIGPKMSYSSGLLPYKAFRWIYSKKTQQDQRMEVVFDLHFVIQKEEAISIRPLPAWDQACAFLCRPCI